MKQKMEVAGTVVAAWRLLQERLGAEAVPELNGNALKVEFSGLQKTPVQMREVIDALGGEVFFSREIPTQVRGGAHATMFAGMMQGASFTAFLTPVGASSTLEVEMRAVASNAAVMADPVALAVFQICDSAIDGSHKRKDMFVDYVAHRLSHASSKKEQARIVAKLLTILADTATNAVA